MNRLEKKNQEIVDKVLRRGQVTLVIEEAYYKDIPKNEREQYAQYFKKIWSMPLLHNERSTNIIQAFWKEILRRSYLANKSGACQKYICQYGQHYRQKFSLYYPKQKPATLLPVVVYIHGGYFINGTEQAFQYLGKGFVEKGYLMATMGFRQLPKYRWPDPYDDCHTGYKQLIKIVEKHGGDPNNIIFLSWSGGGLVSLVNFFRFPSEYQPRVKLFVALGSPWQISVHEQKIEKVFIDRPQQLNEVMPYGYMGQKLSIPINLVTGTKDKQFPQIYYHNQKYYKVYKDNGLNVTLNQVQNHDHYDLILDVDVALTKIRQFQIKSINPKNELSLLLMSGQYELKKQIDEITKDPIWNRDPSQQLDKLRLDSIKKFRQIQNFVGRNDFVNYSKLFSILEFFSPGDSTVNTKSLTHWSAVGTVQSIGTEKHHKILDQVAAGKAVFAFALTQAGGGNNLSDAGTKATYDQKTGQFILHNETHYSKKFWCANLGMHANYAVVFARLIVKGKNEGTHGFVIRIRDQNHKPLPGILLQDLGHKLALNGIDNGTIMFTNHRVSKDALLNKIANIDQQGNYSCPIKSIGQRFFKVIDRLISGRLFIASSIIGDLKLICMIGVTFSRYRYGVSETGVTQIPIGNYQLQRNDIIPVVSKSIALIFFHQYCKDMFLNNNDHVEVGNLCNFDKILLTEHTTYAAITVRERCGGQGILAVNNLGEYLGIGMAASTGQGDNKVLIMKIAKDCLKLVGEKKLALPISKISKITSIQQLRDLDILLGLLQKRQVSMFKDLTTKVITLKNQRKQPYEIVMKYTWQEMKAFSYAYGDRIALQGALHVLGKLKQPEHLSELKNHFVIYSLTAILANLGYYAYSGLIPEDIAKQIVELRNQLIREAAKKVQLLVHKLNVPEHTRRAPISRPDYFKHVEKGLKVNTSIPPNL